MHMVPDNLLFTIPPADIGATGKQDSRDHGASGPLCRHSVQTLLQPYGRGNRIDCKVGRGNLPNAVNVSLFLHCCCNRLCFVGAVVC